MPEEATILSQRTDTICRLVLNRPDKRNALTPTLIAELRIALTEAAADPQVRVVVISGAGSDFCSGLDLASLEQIAQADVMENMEDASALGQVFTSIRNHPKPVVAAVRGRALAGGCGLATACDVTLAAESASFGYPEVNIGFVPAIVAAMIRRAMPDKQAFDLLTQGEPVSAEDALDLGLITRVFPDSEFDREVERYVLRLAAKSPSAISLTKHSLYHADGLSFEAAIEAGAQVNALARMTEDCRAGIRKFLTKKS
jgi:methylglutaconyl-CoA hydratase